MPEPDPDRSGRALDRRIIALALPALGALVVEPLYNLTDTGIVGHLGRAPLGGLALATTVLNLIGWTSAFLEMATTSAVAFRRGRAEEAGATSSAIAAYVLALALGFVVALVVGLAGPAIAQLLGGSGAIERSATTYLHIAAVGMPFLLLTLAGTGHLTGYADTRTPLRIVLMANVVNVLLEVFLVYGLQLGIAGSAWGTDLAQVVAAAIFVHASWRRARPHLRPPARAEYAVLLRNGTALVIRTIALGAALSASTAIAARLGAAQLGGHQIALQVWLLLALTVDALAVPAQVFVSSALGAGRVSDALHVGRRCLRLGAICGVALGAATVAVSLPLPYVFTADAAARHSGTIALLICGAAQPLAAAAFVLDGLLLGAGDYATLRRGMLIAFVAFAPLAAVTLRDHSVGIAGVWAALTCWLAARSAILGLRWRSGRWAVLDR